MIEIPQTPDDIRSQVEARIREEEEMLPAKPTPVQSVEITPELIRNCLANNERGDGILYALLNKDKFIYNKGSQVWLKYKGHHWEIDYYDKSFTAVEKVAMSYLEESDRLAPQIDRAKKAMDKARNEIKTANKSLASALKKQDSGAMDAAKLLLEKSEEEFEGKDRIYRELLQEYKTFIRRVDRLRGVKGANNCLLWSHCVDSPLACKGDEFDRKPMLLPCKNGVIELGPGRFRPGKPDDMLMRAIPIDWPVEFKGLDAYLCGDPLAESPCPTWERVFSEILQDDQEIVSFLGRYLGYVITGLTHHQYYLFCIGEGANGKGLIFDTIASIMGDLAWSISPELLLEQKNSRSSAGPSADIVSLMGRRLVIASESDENKRISQAMLKRLTGEEKIAARSPHDKFEINFDPNFKVIFRTNEVPHGITRGFSMIRRLLYVHFPLMYVDDPAAEAELKPQQAHLFRQKDGDLREKLKKEQQGILVWLVREWLRCQKYGLNPPASIRAAVETLRKEEDHFSRFIDECCKVDPDDKSYEVAFSEFYNSFKKWFGLYIDEKHKYFPTSNKIGRELTRRGFKRNNNGDRKVFGIIISDNSLLYGG